MHSDPGIEALDQAAVLKLEGLDTPIIIESIRLLKIDRDYYVQVRSTDGAEGLAFTNGRAPYLYPILNQLIIPYFIGKDARDLEALLIGVYQYSSNYKLLGQALCSPLPGLNLRCSICWAGLPARRLPH